MHSTRSLRAIMQRAQSPQLLGHVRSMVTLPNDNQISGDVDQQGGRRKLELDREAQGVVSRSPNAVSSPPLFILSSKDPLLSSLTPPNHPSSHHRIHPSIHPSIPVCRLLSIAIRSFLLPELAPKRIRSKFHRATMSVSSATSAQRCTSSFGLT